MAATEVLMATDSIRCRAHFAIQGVHGHAVDVSAASQGKHTVAQVADTQADDLMHGTVRMMCSNDKARQFGCR